MWFMRKHNELVLNNPNNLVYHLVLCSNKLCEHIHNILIVTFIFIKFHAQRNQVDKEKETKAKFDTSNRAMDVLLTFSRIVFSSFQLTLIARVLFWN